MVHLKRKRSIPGRVLPLVLGSLLSTTAAAGFLPGFNILQLQDLGFKLSEVHDINNPGFAAGSSVAGGAFEAEARPVFWDAAGNSTQLEFSSNPSSTYQRITDINDSGNMIGLHESLGCAVWIDLVPTTLKSGCGAGINNTNQIVGTSGSFSNNSIRATIWNDLQPSLLGSEPEGYQSVAIALNNPGQVVGTFNQTYDIPVTWLNNQATYLGTLPGLEPNAHPVSINDGGQIVGYSGDRDINKYRAVIWQNGFIADIGTLGGASANAVDINNAGQIIGVSQIASGQSRPFLWQNGVMYDLTPALCADPETCRVSISAINDLGQIVFTEYVDVTYESLPNTVLTDSFAYKLTIADGAMTSLPSVSAPLNFVAADGAGPVGDAPPAIGKADLHVSMSANSSTVVKGGRLQYKIVVTNNGPNLARNVVVIDQLPNNVRFVPSLSDVQICDFPSSTITCNFGRLDAGASATATLTVEHLKGKKIINTATAESATFDPDLSANSATVETLVLRNNPK